MIYRSATFSMTLSDLLKVISWSSYFLIWNNVAWQKIAGRKFAKPQPAEKFRHSRISAVFNYAALCSGQDKN